MRSEFVLSGGVLGMCADCWGGGGRYPAPEGEW